MENLSSSYGIVEVQKESWLEAIPKLLYFSSNIWLPLYLTIFFYCVKYTKLVILWSLRDQIFQEIVEQKSFDSSHECYPLLKQAHIYRRRCTLTFFGSGSFRQFGDILLTETLLRVVALEFLFYFILFSFVKIFINHIFLFRNVECGCGMVST